MERGIAVTGENRCDVLGAHAGALAMQRSADVHQAGVVAGGAYLGLRLLNVLQFFLQHRSGNVGVLDGERAAETAAQIPCFHRNQFQPAHVSQQANWNVAQVQIAQRMTAGVIGDAMRVDCADILDPKAMHQQFGELVHARQQRCHFGLKSLIAGRQRDFFVMFPHHGDAGRRRNADYLAVTENFDESAHQRQRFRLIARVVMHLSAAGLRVRKFDGVPEPLQHSHHGNAYLWKQCVVVARDKQSDSHEEFNSRAEELCNGLHLTAVSGVRLSIRKQFSSRFRVIKFAGMVAGAMRQIVRVERTALPKSNRFHRTEDNRRT